MMNGEYFPLTGKEAKDKGIDPSTELKRNSPFATRLRDLRESKSKSTGKGKGTGFDQQTVAKAIGVTKSSLSLYENGDNLPDARTIRKMAEFYGVSADYLLGLSSTPSRDPRIRDIHEQTGLTAETIKELLNTRSGFFVSSFISYVVDSPAFELFFHYAHEALLCQDELTAYREKHEDAEYAGIVSPVSFVKDKHEERFAIMEIEDAVQLYKIAARNALAGIADGFLGDYSIMLQRRRNATQEADHAEE